jgi:putative ABC transport system permease protein
VIGILPDSFPFPKQVGQLVGFPEHPDFFQPLNGELPYEQDLIGEFDFAAIARLKPGVDPGAALVELNVVQAQIAKQANEGVDLAAAERVLAADVDLPPQSYDKPDARLRFYDQSVAGIRALPGIVSAAWVSILPLEGQGSVTGVSLPGAEETGGKSPIANYRVVGPDYFKTMGIPLSAGREFTVSDRTRHVVLVSQGLADRFWPNQSPIGKICVTSWGPRQNSEVVGVAGDIRTVSLDESPLLMVYTPGKFAGATPDGPQSASIVVRTATDPSGAASAVRSVIRKIDPEVPIVALRPMSLLVAKSVSARRFQMSLALIFALSALLFALSALLLASLGIYGVVAYSVEQRRHELGVRKALGAPDGQLRNMVLRQGMMPVFLGLAARIVTAFFLGRLIGSLLFGVDPLDVPITVTVAFVIVAVALVGCWIPARRATRIDPMVALRYE